VNDLDRELRELFARREADVRGPASPPPGLRTRVRRRQSWTVALAIATSLAVVVASLAGYRALTDRTGTYVPGQTEDRTITAHVPGLVVSYPHAWQLTVFSAERGIRSVDVLSNFELDPGTGDFCGGMPDSAVLLIVQPDVALPGSGEAPPWPVDLNAHDAPAHCDGNGDGIVWRASGRTYGAQAFLGSASTQSDSQALQDAFHGMTFPTFDLDVSGEGIVVASGAIDDEPWTVTAGRAPSEEPRLSIATSQGGGGLVSAGGAPLALRDPTDLVLADEVMHGNTFVLGGVTGSVDRIRIAPDGADPFEVSPTELPAVLRSSAETFVVPLEGAPSGTLTTLDADGLELASVRFAPGVACWPGHPCPGTSVEEGVVARGTTADVAWRLVEAHGGVDLLDDQGTVVASVDGGGTGLTATTTTLGSGDGAATFPFGIGPPGTTSVVLFTSGLPGSESTAPLPDGRLAFWGPYSPATGKGQILAFDAGCNLVGAVDLETGEPPSRPATTDCST